MLIKKGGNRDAAGIMDGAGRAGRLSDAFFAVLPPPHILCGTLGAALAAQIARYCGWPPLNKANFYGFMLAIAGACLVQGVALLIGKRLK